MLDDFGQKWFHTFQQLDQVNAYGQLASYKSARSKLVPKPVTQPKTDWRSGTVASKAKPKRQHAPQQMTAPAPTRPQAGRGNGGGPRPPATAPIAVVVILP